MTTMPIDDQQWPPAEGPAGTPHEGQETDPNTDAPIGDRLGRDPGNIGQDIPAGGDVVYPPAEAPTPQM
jgi:hypothetical protein